jgi:RHS repeat-associated protein
MKRRTLLSSLFRASSVRRRAVTLAIAGQLVIGSPMLAQDATRAVVQAGSRAANDLERKAAKARVRVNRTVPAVTPPSLDVSFGAEVSTAEVRRVRMFSELLTPTREPSAEENRDVARVLQLLASGSVTSDGYIAHLDRFFVDHPASPWRASLAANAAAFYARAGYFSRAAAMWDQAWELTRDSNELPVRAIADFTLGASLTQMATFGQVSRLEQRLDEIKGRDVRGSAAAKVQAAREAYFVLTTHHEMAAYSGPEALKMYLTVAPTVAPTSTLEKTVRAIAAYKAPMMGTTLRELRDLAGTAGLALDMIRVAPLGAIPIPSVVHLRSQHFAAIVSHEDGEVVLRDPSLGGTLRLSEAALRDEMSGYFLVAPDPARDPSWQAVTESDADNIVGHCQVGGPNDLEPFSPEWWRKLVQLLSEGSDSNRSGRNQSNQSGNQPPRPTKPCVTGMPRYDFQPTIAGLIITDIPLGCVPPVGPEAMFRVSYDHRDARHPQTAAYSHLGPRWSFDWLSYVTDNPYCVIGPCPAAGVVLRGSGVEAYPTPPATHPLSRAQLIKVANDPPRYERELPDGTVEVFTLPDRAATQYNRRIFLTEVIDPQGHALTFTYDSSFRIVAVTDAIGQVTTLEYLDTADPLRVTRVTDPFSRVATLTYDGLGRLETLTDVAGLTSRFSYGSADFIVSMTTPYGTTTFQHEPDPTQTKFFRRIEATDPAGGTERLEFHWTHAQLSATESSSVVPTGFSASNASLNYYNSLYWDKQAMAQAPGDLASATILSWMLGGEEADTHASSRTVPHSVKRPLENRVWFRYPDQASGSHHSHGTGRSPALIGRVLDGGGSQVTQLGFNLRGFVTSRTDPVGRQTTYSYASNGIDLLEVRQVVSGTTELRLVYSDYTSQHGPQTIVDAAGETTTVTYNGDGQLLTMTNPLDQTTTYAYESGTGYLLSVTGPVSGATTEFAYDGYGRLASVEDPDGYLVLVDYDALDRITQYTFPDDTTESNTYTRLDLATQIDRLGRVTRHFYDGFGRLTSTRDPAGRMASLVWCACGTLDALIDAKGQRTRWERDGQGRVTRELRADNTTDTIYTYDVTGRLKTVTDPEDQVTTYTYNVDDTLQQVAFTNVNISTPTISYTYDTYYPRPLTMVDGVGTTTFSYKAAGTAGALSLASVDGPLSSDTIVYAYDELGRVASRLLNSTGTEITYDTLGRVSTLEFPIGTFEYTFDGQTSRVASVTYPNDQTTTYTYFNNAGDRRLQTIHHKNPSAATLSKFDYTYDAVGNILTWRQERAGATTQRYTFTNDAVDQLISAVLTDTNTTPTLLKRQAWAYDAAGNRSVDQTDDAVFASSHNNLNQLASRAPGGAIVMAGSVNEAATVTIAGAPATVDASNNFRGTATIGSGTTTVTVKAKDPSGNEATQQYEIEASGSTTSYTYDANGNLTSDGTKTYFWNALNQLVEVKEGTTTLATFEYDGGGRRTEKNAAGLTYAYIYDAEDIVEERISGSSSDTIRYYHGAGIDEPLARKNSSEVVTYYLADHLGSIVQETSASGVVGLDREYDPWGVLVQGGSTPGYSFTGREWDAEIGMYYYRNRYYDADLSRFISEDPSGLDAGPNLYSYVLSGPTSATDPFGLQLNQNNSKVPVLVKREEFKDGFEWVPPGGKFDGPIDGVKPPSWNGDWYKVPDGTKVTIDKNGEPHETNGPGWWTPDAPDFGGPTDAFGGRKQNPAWDQRHGDWKYPPDDPTRDPNRRQQAQGGSCP